MGWRRRQHGKGTISFLADVIVIGAVCFVLVIAAAAKLDISGFESDLEDNIFRMQFSCVHSPCEEEFFDELEDLLILKGRDLEIDWDGVDLLGAENELVVKGWKVLDFKIWKYYYYFTIRVEIGR